MLVRPDVLMRQRVWWGTPAQQRARRKGTGLRRRKIKHAGG
jgi:hypothetical protein